MKFIKFKGHFESDCSDVEREIILHVDDILAIYESVGRIVINLKSPIKETNLKLDLFKIFVRRDINDFYKLINKDYSAGESSNE